MRSIGSVHRRLMLGLTVSAVALMIPLLAAGQEPEGKTIFVENNCNLCHSISSQEVAKKSEKMKAPDLSNVGAKVESADWLKGFLKKEQKLDGKLHRQNFKGTDSQLDGLVKWLMSLKTS